ncbi:gluconokinase [Nocardia sp. NPDC004604]|uniref:gluconokinase n=1 Tax=Nocardia sp. NPDC004604 TaxID=3157013 RepID=UPI0033A71804
MRMTGGGRMTGGPERSAAPVIVVMGVSGCGKSTVGVLLADTLHIEYAEGDDFHPAANIAKMTAGVPLTDSDRAPWLDIVAAWLGERQERGGVVSCSALARSYRDRLRAAAPGAFFVHLAASRAELARRMAERRGHFMPSTLLDSQLAALQPLACDELGVTVDATKDPAELVREAVTVWESN